jgi:hypothetical protein
MNLNQYIYANSSLGIWILISLTYSVLSINLSVYIQALCILNIKFIYYSI